MKRTPGVHLRPVEFRIVCAVARVVFLRQPSMTDSEWKAATKDALAKQQFEEPGADMVQRALGAVERALAATMGPRPLPPAPEAPPVEQTPGPSRGDWQAMAATVQRILARTAATQSPTVVQMVLETLDLGEPEALDVFYREAQVDALAALQRFAELAIRRPADWDYAGIRAAAPTSRPLHNGQCYGCRGRARVLNTHHVIQIQHGGSNAPRNQVAICDGCHAAIHPWLPKAVKAASGWSSLSEIAPAGVAAVDRLRKAQKQVS